VNARPEDTARPGANQAALVRAARAFVQMLPVVIGMLLLTSLLLAWLPRAGLTDWFGRQPALDMLLGAVIGSVAMGHPLAGYVLGGELLVAGVDLAAVTAMIVGWVTVGAAHVPAEALALGWRFALVRNALCFMSAFAVAYLTVGLLRVMA